MGTEEQINNEAVFPTKETSKFPENFEAIASKMFTRIFRIFAIIYHSHFENLEKLDAASHLNTVFKHFVYFTLEYDLLPEKETKALEGPYLRLKKEFKEAPVE